MCVFFTAASPTYCTTYEFSKIIDAVEYAGIVLIPYDIRHIRTDNGYNYSKRLGGSGHRPAGNSLLQGHLEWDTLEITTSPEKT